MTPAVEEPKELDRIQGVLEPAGYRILVRIPNLEAQLKKNQNLYMPEETRRLEEFAQLTAQVIALGPLAYADKEKYGEPWCKEGDFVLIRSYAGTRFQMGEAIYALINDDTVQGVVRGDHQEIERVR